MKYSNDKEIIFGCITCRKDALEAFVKKFSDPIYRSIQYYLRTSNISYSRQDLEDLHHTIFLRLFEKRCKKLRQYKGKNGCSLHSWVRMIAVRTVIDYLRKENVDALGRQKSYLLIEELDFLKSENPTPLALIDRNEEWALVQDGIKKLRPRERLFLKLHCMKGLSIQEVADIMGISEANAYSVKHRAIQRLRSHVKSKVK
jgi:RNA polymerase sigma-70 factor (ECF subfamily)